MYTHTRTAIGNDPTCPLERSEELMEESPHGRPTRATGIKAFFPPYINHGPAPPLDCQAS